MSLIIVEIEEYIELNSFQVQAPFSSSGKVSGSRANLKWIPELLPVIALWTILLSSRMLLLVNYQVTFNEKIFLLLMIPNF